MTNGWGKTIPRVFYFTLYILFLLFNWLMFDVGFGECFTSKYSPGLEYQYYWSNMFLFILLLLFSRSFSFQKFQNIFLQAVNGKKIETEKFNQTSFILYSNLKLLGVKILNCKSKMLWSLIIAKIKFPLELPN